MDSSKGGFAIPFSVIIPEINSGGVISNAGLITLIPSGAVFFSPTPVTSAWKIVFYWFHPSALRIPFEPCIPPC